MMTQKTFTFSYSKVIAKLNEITDSNKANKPFKEKFGFRL